MALHGFGLAAELAAAELGVRGRTCRLARDRLLDGLRALGARIHGDLERHVGNTVNAAFEGCDGQLLMMALDVEGVAISTGAACSSGSLEPSPVLLALGLSPERAREAVRFSMPPAIELSQVEQVLACLPKIVSRVRGSVS